MFLRRWVEVSDSYTPRPGHHFTFGLWTVGNTGRDGWGREARPPLDPAEAVRRLASLGAYGVNLHDEDLVPWGSSAAERDRIVAGFRKALDETGMKAPMISTNLAAHPAFKDGSFTSNNPAVRRFAMSKTMRAIDLGVGLGAGICVMWGGREGVECDAAKDIAAALDRYAEGINACCAYARSMRYDLRFALEPKPNEPRGNLLLPTVGHALAFISSLEWPGMVGLNPEFAHEVMSGLSYPHALAQCLRAGKLFHVDLNGQVPGRFDEDFRFGSVGIREAFYTVKVLEDARWDGMRHFDCHPYRTEDVDGVWDFAAGCMRSYLVLAEKARRFREDPEIRAALADAMLPDLMVPQVDWRDCSAVAAIRDEMFDETELARRGYGHELLDQLVWDLLAGLR
jgi:xylose isomerase